MIYVDTSALAKLALPERESSEVAALLEGQQLFSSALIDIELSKVWQRSGLTGAGYRKFTEGVSKVGISDEVIRRACSLTGVRSLDAIHLASACLLRDAGLTLTFFTYDKQLHAAAQSQGFAVFPSPQ
ncbi:MULTISPECIES: type II toxin-antitoxin system VapC family toxin [unclassified Corynebacterium]|uniref:type II toxin-antitoxin system VapC family toxin n=2 Tax=Corynebacterium TaxID=1716 RepID=UPI0008A2A9A5|nr:MULTISPECIES: type II toxin-antitoxin system VapC family toxin [unclassified Corynebacterium]OFK67761.1 hypothetical protein HMPREF2806_08375 [Corynebacterium sp. HMSC076G08]OFK69589.1 hypothetical protein HMPREF2807_01980 [Corynebacterium sp. HMSC074A09]OFN76890.1 hypothetical protein HMPREF2537_02085 [Corynebacterium sp. HMSC074E01]OFN77010.1 hypothetical protein HMPREF2526_09500 [Corynebacterium sp. HMSC070E08]OFO19762.1 hypothetical protein HMPREF3056_01490 [Corynebacterium sp. HMSC056F